ncbi:hypothetical protein FRACA_1560002 [Frankia canadensis]|uniref:Alpha/beta hydrolase domain-containing protein n=1 Tax=Frankia canadensis TaxID=1836972 RepID=A0A2I2KMB3_9ACTN|nr:hypothetical protein FRACA_1560002 [Frankia canadensis]SOU54082.1 hypothetical protein FRACA_1560002 [Frankia canadensis]
MSTYGYVEEYFLEGDATTYRPIDGESRVDGRWTAEPSGSLPFRTRMVVRCPSTRRRSTALSSSRGTTSPRAPTGTPSARPR